MIVLRNANQEYEVRNVKVEDDGSFQAEFCDNGFWNVCYGDSKNLVTVPDQPESLPLDLYADDYYTEEVQAVNQYNQDVLVLRDYAYDWQEAVTAELRVLWIQEAA